MSAHWTSVSFDALPGFGRFFVDHAGGRLPSALRTLAGPDDLRGLEERALARPPKPLEKDLAAALEIEHRRLGAPAASLAAVRELAGGTAYAVITGQQPGLLGGPVFTYLKVATVVALARRLSDLHGMRAVPILWNGADDADFDEVSSAQVPSSDLAIVRLTVPSSEHHPRTWVGDISGEATAAVMESLDPILGRAGLPGFERWCAWRERTRAIARDFGDWTTAHYLHWFGEDGLVVVDARLPEIRRAARPLFRDYLERADAVRSAILRQGERMEREGYPPGAPPAQPAAGGGIGAFRHPRPRAAPASAGGNAGRGAPARRNPPGAAFAERGAPADRRRHDLSRARARPRSLGDGLLLAARPGLRHPRSAATGHRRPPLADAPDR